MKIKLIIFAILIVIFTTGCQENITIPEGYYPYNEAEVETAIDTLSFQPDIPKFVPMKVEFLVSDHFTLMETNREALDISFYTRENDLLSIQFVEGDLNETLIEPESVTIDEEIDGEYVDNSYAKMLYWKNDGVTYKMTYRSSAVNEDIDKVSREDMVEVAKSFHS